MNARPEGQGDEPSSTEWLLGQLGDEPDETAALPVVEDSADEATQALPVVRGGDDAETRALPVVEGVVVDEATQALPVVGGAQGEETQALPVVEGVVVDEATQALPVQSSDGAVEANTPSAVNDAGADGAPDADADADAGAGAEAPDHVELPVTADAESVPGAADAARIDAVRAARAPAPGSHPGVAFVLPAAGAGADAGAAEVGTGVDAGVNDGLNGDAVPGGPEAAAAPSVPGGPEAAVAPSVPDQSDAVPPKPEAEPSPTEQGGAAGIEERSAAAPASPAGTDDAADADADADADGDGAAAQSAADNPFEDSARFFPWSLSPSAAAGSGTDTDAATDTSGTGSPGPTAGTVGAAGTAVGAAAGAPALFKPPPGGAAPGPVEPLSWTVIDTSAATEPTEPGAPSAADSAAEAAGSAGTADVDGATGTEASATLDGDPAVVPPAPVAGDPTTDPAEAVAVASSEAIELSADDLVALATPHDAQAPASVEDEELAALTAANDDSLAALAAANNAENGGIDDELDGIDDPVPAPGAAVPGVGRRSASARGRAGDRDVATEPEPEPELDIDPINDSAVFGEALVQGTQPVSAVRASSASVVPAVLPQDEVTASEPDPTTPVETVAAPHGGGSGGGSGRRARPSEGAGGTRFVLIAVAGLIVFFVIGLFLPRLFTGGTPAAIPTPTATPTATATPTEAQGPAALGVQPWTALNGGECLSDYTDPWQAEFTVVDCAQPHQAQLVAVGEITDDPAAAYPGEEELASQIGLWCAAPGTIRSDGEVPVSELQVQGSYPVNDDEWTADGDRSYRCFVSRAEGGELSEDLVAG
ncbi:septum formation family protein [Mycetocola reblochoni]|uniref:Septum formation-related domain-containing protein n=2 Tax=Mycetocola reblochoni TaxID=331618 RepID=A0A1R4IN60_9MICO|nr:septum formation family protein [Mycetocola reblochoni]RLP67897.1 hypothetical protein D9V30_12220 [Mycetocola reblochoni]SJN21346.1 hypothetical protein FM119_02745 [Mycetocola reblochoni REB411]